MARSLIGRPTSAWIRLKSSTADGVKSEMPSSRSRKTVAIAVDAIRFCRSLLAWLELVDLALQLLVDGGELLVDRLQLLAAGLELLGRRPQLLVHRLQLFVARLQLLRVTAALLGRVAQVPLELVDLLLQVAHRRRPRRAVDDGCGARWPPAVARGT